MTLPFTVRLPVPLLIAILSLVGAGCSCSESVGVDADGSVPADGAAGDGSTTDGGAGDAGDRCVGGTLCGMPVSCCPAGNECVEGACLPVCESGVRCGADRSVCCGDGELCVAGACAVPGPECGDSYDCEQPGEFCEPTLGRCLPQPDEVSCTVVPDFEELDVSVEWSFEDDQIISIPVVADIDGDGMPEVVVNVTQQDGGGWPGGNVVAFSGDGGAEELRIPHDPDADAYGSHGRSTLAVGDVSGDGLPDIVYAGRPGTADGGESLLVAVDHEGNLLWTSHDPDDSPHGFRPENAAVTLANFDDDPMAEVVLGASLLDHDGTVLWDEGGDGALFGSNGGYRGGISVVADIDGDGAPEIVSGRHAWEVTWDAGPPVTADVVEKWAYPGADGYPAIADLDGNGTPEVVLVASSRIIALDGATGELFCGVDPTDAACDADDGMRTQPIDIPGGSSSNRGGPATIADFDGDGRPEIGVAGGYAYSVYDLNRDGETIVTPDGDPEPAAGALFVRWSRDTQDLSSNATGSSVFDFQGDGSAEVVYADECYMRVYSGSDGTPQLEIPSTSATIHEYPLVVDVDGDNNSEILIVSNEKGCGDVEVRHGLYVYGDPNDEWVPTRRVWTQHTYHVTNATSAGNVPEMERDNWTAPGLNNYRQNVQGDGVFNAPDLTLDLSVGLDRCAEGMLTLLARVNNEGALGVGAGIEVRFYEGTDDTGTELGIATTSEAILPGGSTVVSIDVEAPADPASYYAEADGGADGVIVECDESNNDAGATGASCVFLE